MNHQKTCPRCGATLPADAPEGLCPQCLLKGGFDPGAATVRSTTSQTGGSAPKSPTPPPRPAEIAPNFPQLEILELLGQGGMGIVYKARQPHLERFVALKILSPEVGRDPAFAERFAREARALARLNHPNIVAVYDFGQAGGYYFLLMEYVDGVNLRQLEHSRRLTPEEALAIVPKICEALQYAHDEGIVHRDIKPGNVLLDKRGRLKIADFGLAKLMGQPATDLTLTQSHQMMGTPAYMAPEQMERPNAVDHRADIYSLGVVFYEMLTGELPIGRFASPSQKVQVDVRLDEVVLKTLEKEPDRRYQRAGEIKTDVETIARTEPVAAPQQAHSFLERAAQQLRSETTAGQLNAIKAVLLALTIVGLLCFVSADGFASRERFEWKVGEPDPWLRVHSEPGTNQGFAIHLFSWSWPILGLSFLALYSLALIRKAEGYPGTLRFGAWTIVAFIAASALSSAFGLLPNLAKARTPAARPDAVSRLASSKPPVAIAPFSAEEARQCQKRWADPLGTPVLSTNSIGMKLALIPPGAFDMGSREEDLTLLPRLSAQWFFARWATERIQCETPQHRVRLNQVFLMGVHEVTVGQFREFVRATGHRTEAERDPEGGYGWSDGQWEQKPEFNWRNPGFPQSDNHPIGNVSWDDAAAFCQWLSTKEKKKYRLPTEAEWEFACRAGTTTWYSAGDRDQSLQSVANIADVSLRDRYPAMEWAESWNDGFLYTAPVGSFEPNAFGLHDMHGNVWEWCADFYDPTYFGRSPSVDPAGPTDPPRSNPEAYRVFRGGGWDNYPGFCRSADRYSSHSTTLRTSWAGFRVVREP